MALFKDNSVIHAAADADLTEFTYTQVYAGSDASPTINGTTVTMTAGSTLDIRVGEISPTNGIFLVGSPINTLKVDIIL